jgi:predicted Zn-dependent protease
MLLTEKEARAICEKLLSYVKADDAVVGVTSENYGHLRFASNAFTTSGARENVSVGVTVWIDKKRGAASTNEIDDESLKATVALAEQLARISPVDRGIYRRSANRLTNPSTDTLKQPQTSPSPPAPGPSTTSSPRVKSRK